MDVVGRILRLMEINSVTATELSIATGVYASSITKWKKGIQKPSTEAIVKIADYFGVTTDYLLIGAGPQAQLIKNKEKNFMYKRYLKRDEIVRGLLAFFENDVSHYFDMEEIINNNFLALQESTGMSEKRLEDFLCLAYNKKLGGKTESQIETLYPTSIEFDIMILRSGCTQKAAIEFQQRLTAEYNIALKEKQAEDAGFLNAN